MQQEGFPHHAAESLAEKVMIFSVVVYRQQRHLRHVGQGYRSWLKGLHLFLKIAFSLRADVDMLLILDQNASALPQPIHGHMIPVHRNTPQATQQPAQSRLVHELLGAHPVNLLSGEERAKRRAIHAAHVVADHNHWGAERLLPRPIRNIGNFRAERQADESHQRPANAPVQDTV